jgi:BTB/POZ domain
MKDQIQELTAPSSGQWAPFEFTYPNSVPVCQSCSRCTVYPTVHLKLNFEKPGTFRENHLYEYLTRNKKTADVKFIVGKQEIFAHSAIVAKNSLVLAAKLESKQLKRMKMQSISDSEAITEMKVIEIDDVSAQIFEFLIDLMYESMDDITAVLDDKTKDLFLAAEKYQAKDVLDEIDYWLSDCVYSGNALDYLVFSYVHNASRTLEYTLQYLVNNKEKVCKTREWKKLLRDHPEVFYLAAQRMSTGTPDDEPDDCFSVKSHSEHSKSESSESEDSESDDSKSEDSKSEDSKSDDSKSEDSQSESENVR